MTLLELITAMWDSRPVTLTDAMAQTIEDATPIGLRRTLSPGIWTVYYTRPGIGDWESCILRFDSFDSH